VVEASSKTFLIEGLDLSHLLRGELEVKDFSVAGDSGSSDRLGDNNSRSLESPTEENMSSCFSMGFSDLVDDSIVHKRRRSMMLRHNIARRSERGVGSDYDLVINTVLD